MDTDLDTDSDMFFCFGLNRNKPKLDLFWFCFGLFAKLACNGHGHGHGYGHFSFALNGLWVFWLYQNTETTCFDFKAKQLKQSLVSDSAETSFGSSFVYIETKLVS